MRTRTNPRAHMDDSRRMNPRRIPPRRMKQFQCPRERKIRILRPQHRRRNNREVLADNHSRSARSPRRPRIFRIGDKRKFPRPSLFDPIQPGNLRLRRPILKTHLKCRSNRRKFHGCRVNDELNRNTRGQEGAPHFSLPLRGVGFRRRAQRVWTPHRQLIWSMCDRLRFLLHSERECTLRGK